MKNTPVPHNFWQYLRSMGPGIIVALTWLGAGDLVDSAIAGGSYGYALMWAMAIALFVRFIFVSIIAKYQLCNQHNESLMSGLKRLHISLPIFIGVVALFFGHFYGSYMVKGVGESSEKLFGFGAAWIWSIFWVTIAAIIIFKGALKRIEIIFYIFLILLSSSLIGVAIWTGPDPISATKGILMFDIPETSGSFGSLLVITSLIGAVGGSIANLLYPYFIQQKGWNRPKFRKVQLYDLAFGTIILVVINMSIWTIGAELLFPKNISINNLDDLGLLLTLTIGKYGEPIFFIGVFAALYSSVIGNAVGFGFLITDTVQVIKSNHTIKSEPLNVSQSKIYRFVIIWCLFSPLIWSIPNMPSFITLTLVANASAVIVLPILCGSLWYITSSKFFIGSKYKNGALEHLTLIILFILSIWGSYQAIFVIKELLNI
ncbi:MAG: divalent metal cation transporter [Alphaproteobacteria bacterium]|nr:divalent metal cation transporter [Alphaproteobacteria bacterium]